MNEQPTTAVGTLRMLAATQTEVDIFSDQVIQAIKEGHTDPLEVLVYLKAFEKVSERIIKETKENQLKAAEKWSEQSFNHFGADIAKRSTKTTYDYSICKDSELNDLESEAKELAEKIEARKTFLKALTKPLEILQEGGELITVRPPVKKENQGLVVTIK